MPLSTSKHRLLPHQGSIISFVLLPLLLNLFLSQVKHIPCVDATVRVNLEEYPEDLKSFGNEFLSHPANFGRRFNTSVEYNSNLFMPIQDQYLCRDTLNRELLGGEILEAAGFDVDLQPDEENGEVGRILSDHRLSEEDRSQLLSIVQREEGDRVEANPSSLRRRRQSAVDPVSITLLVSRGRCSFEAKARGAMALNDYFKKIFKGESPIDIQYVIVHNDVVGDNNPVLMAGPSKGIDVGLTFVTTAVGYRLKTLLLRVAVDQKASPFLQERTIVNVFSDQSDHAIPYVLLKFPITIVNHLDENNEMTPTGSTTTKRSRRDNFYWVRFVLFAMLIITPFLRGAFLWYSAGGRIRFRRTRRGCIYGIRIVRPRQRWVNIGWRTPTAVNHQNEHGNGDKMTEEEVMALPEIVYGADGDEEGGDEVGQRGGSPTVQTSGQTTETPNGVAIIASNTSGAVDPEAAQSEKILSSCTMCSICIEEFEPGEKLRVLPKCHHAFHLDCILPWLTERQGCCPTCKTPVLGDATAESSPDESIEMVAMEGVTLPSSSFDEAEGIQARRESAEEGSTNVVSIAPSAQQAPAVDTFEDEIVGGNVPVVRNGEAEIADATVISGGGTATAVAVSASDRANTDNSEESGNPLDGVMDVEGDGSPFNDIANDENGGPTISSVSSGEGDTSLITNPDELCSDKNGESGMGGSEVAVANNDAEEVENTNAEENDAGNEHSDRPSTPAEKKSASPRSD